MDQISRDIEQIEKVEPIPTVRKRSRISSIIAAILPFVQSIPPLAAWGALMTIPLVGYLALLFTSGPLHFIEAIFQLFFGGFIWEQIIAVLGLGVLVYSFVHMRLNKSEGLITSGPYGLVRHPQYFGVILFTLTLTTRSYWIATNTFGMSWIRPELTVAIWFGTLFAYVVLALVEELHLSKMFQSEYTEYCQSTGFLFPFIRSRKRVVEVTLSILLPGLILAGMIFFAPPFPMIF